MSQDNQKNFPSSHGSAASSDTDSESGVQKLNAAQEYQSALRALDIMREKRLIDDEEYKQRMSEIKKAYE